MKLEKGRIIMNKLMTRLLNLPGVIVEKKQETENTLILFVKSAKQIAASVVVK